MGKGCVCHKEWWKIEGDRWKGVSKCEIRIAEFGRVRGIPHEREILDWPYYAPNPLRGNSGIKGFRG